MEQKFNNMIIYLIYDHSIKFLFHFFIIFSKSMCSKYFTYTEVIFKSSRYYGLFHINIFLQIFFKNLVFELQTCLGYEKISIFDGKSIFGDHKKS